MLGSTMTKLVSVFAVGLPLCLLGGLAYSAASGKSLLQGCLQAYAALYKIPGRPQAVPLISIPITACLQPMININCSGASYVPSACCCLYAHGHHAVN